MTSKWLWRVVRVVTKIKEMRARWTAIKTQVICCKMRLDKTKIKVKVKIMLPETTQVECKIMKSDKTKTRVQPKILAMTTSSGTKEVHDILPNISVAN